MKRKVWGLQRTAAIAPVLSICLAFLVGCSSPEDNAPVERQARQEGLGSDHDTPEAREATPEADISGCWNIRSLAGISQLDIEETEDGISGYLSHGDSIYYLEDPSFKTGVLRFVAYLSEDDEEVRTEMIFDKVSDESMSGVSKGGTVKSVLGFTEFISADRTCE